MRDYFVNITLKGKLYTKKIPPTISNAIFLYGDGDIDKVSAFIDVSDSLDGSQGMIITNEAIYYRFTTPRKIKFDEIKELTLDVKRNKVVGYIKADKNYMFDDIPIDIDSLIHILSIVSGKEIDYVMEPYERVAYFLPIIIDDIECDEYEDLILTHDQHNRLKDLKDNLDIIYSLNDEDYQYELEKIVIEALDFFDELEIGSDEIDELYKAKDALDERERQDDQVVDQAMGYYQEMMKDYYNGDTTKFDQMNTYMKSLGIDMDDLKNKSPQEIDEMIDDLCDRFHISRSQLEKMMNRFNKK